MDTDRHRFCHETQSPSCRLLACVLSPWPPSPALEQTVNDLLPKLAAAKVEDRYSAQMELQSLALNAARPGAEAERAELAEHPRRQSHRRGRAAAGSGLGRAPA